MTQFESYSERYSCVRMHRKDGILELYLHKHGGPALWGAAKGGIHEQLGGEDRTGLARFQRRGSSEIAPRTVSADGDACKAGLCPADGSADVPEGRREGMLRCEAVVDR